MLSPFAVQVKLNIVYRLYPIQSRKLEKAEYPDTADNKDKEGSSLHRKESMNPENKTRTSRNRNRHTDYVVTSLLEIQNWSLLSVFSISSLVPELHEPWIHFTGSSFCRSFKILLCVNTSIWETAA